MVDKFKDKISFHFIKYIDYVLLANDILLRQSIYLSISHDIKDQ